MHLNIPCDVPGYARDYVTTKNWKFMGHHFAELLENELRSVALRWQHS
jgi:hypothetical protein